MPRNGDATRRRIIEAAYDLFYKGGFARAGVDAIAEAAQVTKRTLYYHFSSKDALLGAVLDAQHELALERIQRWARRARGDPRVMVEILFVELAAWAGRRGWRGSGFTRAAMELADLPGHPARSAARRHKEAVEDWLARQFEHGRIHNPRQVARQIMLLIEGCHALILIHGDTGYARAAAGVARFLVDQRHTALPTRKATRSSNPASRKAGR